MGHPKETFKPDMVHGIVFLKLKSIIKVKKCEMMLKIASSLKLLSLANVMKNVGWAVISLKHSLNRHLLLNNSMQVIMTAEYVKLIGKLSGDLLS